MSGHVRTLPPKFWLTLYRRLLCIIELKSLRVKSYVRTVICDAKTGQESASHIAQAQLYMYLLPKAPGGRWRGVKFEGVVVYADGSERHISSDSVDDAFVSAAG